VLVFTTPRGIEGINGGKLTLGANASVAAGPVGRDGSAGTDATFRAEIYSYSRSRGVFAGLALDGTVLSMDDKANAEFYKKPGVAAGDILAGNVTSDDEAIKRFMSAVHTSTGGTTPQRTASVTPPAPTGGAPASPAAPSGAQSFPLSDPQPGREPH
jgi:lipid-binding SYLF domain-containing protein